MAAAWVWLANAALGPPFTAGKERMAPYPPSLLFARLRRVKRREGELRCAFYPA